VLLGPVGGLAGLIYGEMTSEHADAVISQGSLTVFIESASAARVGDGTSCGGVICDGCPTVLIGGPQAASVARKGDGGWTVSSSVLWM
jgi:hypothetical protein